LGQRDVVDQDQIVDGINLRERITQAGEFRGGCEWPLDVINDQINRSVVWVGLKISGFFGDKLSSWNRIDCGADHDGPLR
jgi:hypothetical protein